MKNRVVWLLMISLIIIFSFISFATGETQNKYPDREITIIVPYDVGGSTDTYIRILAKDLEEIVGQKIKILNISGGEGVPAFRRLMQEPADGYTILGVGTQDILNTLYGRTDFNDLTPLIVANWDQSLLWSHMGEGAFETFQDLIENAKDTTIRQKWNGGYVYDELVQAAVVKAMGIKINYVPYTHAPVANAALAGGFFDVGIDELEGMLGLWDAGTVKPLVVISDEPLSTYPEIPTIESFGYESPVWPRRWRGLAVKGGTPKEIVDYLCTVIKKSAESQEYKKFLEMTNTGERPGVFTAEEAKKHMDAEITVYGELMKELGMIE
jgi:putative tricarboxylic transport membrane protein